MSVRIIDAVFRHSRSRGSARLVLLALADVAADTGEVTAYARSQKALAAKANVDKGTVARSIDTLVELGELVVLNQGDGRRSSDYRILVTAEGRQIEDPQSADPGRVDRVPRDGELHTQGAQDAHPIIPSLTVDPPSPVRQPAGAGKKHLLPDDFAIDLTMRAWAQEAGISIDLDRELDKFRDYWKSKGERRADWVATWRNWMRRANDDAAARPSRPGRPRPPAPVEPRRAPDAPEGGRVQL